MTERHVYTGRELTTLLEQVRRELGSEATIVEANKVRTGGVAGFFATEKFEVVATSPPAASLVDEAPEESIDLDVIDAGDRTRRRESQPSETRPTLRTALLDRADAISIQERIELSRPPRRRDEAVGDPPRQQLMEDQAAPLGVPFIDVLTDELRRDERPAHGSPLSTASTAEPVAIGADAVAPVADGSIAAGPLTGDHPVGRVSPSAFWARVEAIAEDFDGCDVEGSVTSIVGELDAGLALARRLDSTVDGSRRELIVVCQLEAVFIDHAQIVRTNDELDVLLSDAVERGAECLVVVDRRVGARAESHLRRARAHGGGVNRLVLTAPEGPEVVLDRVARFGPGAVVDLVFSAEPSYVLELVEAGVSVATVAGHRLDRLLLTALACCVSNEL